MKRKAKVSITEVRRVGATIMDAPAVRTDRDSAEAPVAAVAALAEELGRLLARRLLTDPGRRRGYGLPELLLGAAVMAVAWVLLARFLG